MLFSAKSGVVNALRFVTVPAILFLIAFYGAHKDEDLREISVLMYICSVLAIVLWLVRTVELKYRTPRQDYLPKKLTKVYVANDFNGFSVIIRRYNDKLLNSINKTIGFRQKAIDFLNSPVIAIGFPLIATLLFVFLGVKELSLENLLHTALLFTLTVSGVHLVFAIINSILTYSILFNIENPTLEKGEEPGLLYNIDLINSNIDYLLGEDAIENFSIKDLNNIINELLVSKYSLHTAILLEALIDASNISVKSSQRVFEETEKSLFQQLNKLIVALKEDNDSEVFNQKTLEKEKVMSAEEQMKTIADNAVSAVGNLQG